MDGYTAFGASITFNGSKQTFTCAAPSAVLADLDVIAAAPAHMNSWGYADLLAKVTAGADWILADALHVEPIKPDAWEIIQQPLRQLVAQPGGARSGNADALAKLMEGLLLSGFAMQAAESSRAASGAEHQFSHLWDMQHHTHNGSAPSHGFKVGIGTLAVTALYEFILEQPINALNVNACVQKWPAENTLSATIRQVLPAQDLSEIALQESHAKWISPAALIEQLELLKTVWPVLMPRLRRQLIPLAELRRMLSEAGAPVEPEEIGITRERLRSTFLQAYLIRRRFTVLDVAVRCGLLEQALDHLLGPNGPWPVKRRDC
jgi:glycerol-1-phosphate dehydrogenase [NAD(P)+]